MRMHLVHRFKRTVVPLIVNVVGWMFGSQVRRVCCLEWLIRLPNLSVFSQISHLIANLKPLR